LQRFSITQEEIVMKRTVTLMAVMTAVLFSASARAMQHFLPMPPTCSISADMEKTLLKYPLGVITKQAAFSHHGKATREVKLPNGNEGWVYQVGEEYGLRTYTLEFSNKGVVTDVLYNEKGRHNGLTALQLQAQAAKILGPEAETPPFRQHAPEEFGRPK
jgi:hypothetical protein